ncbi:hypothetical protein AOR_1_154094 [Paecilomyces variotii No. 5]|uniref:Uncharacterized protein n=1 Tax=Byssochlamys spectabilis (strain No. 5 / NBRC 109023) TaxID=1356009 RepID=V5FJ87_BYSSN|nr:hypothetical protein AOR_1_154094 [Paecilomyces variotii No. 5]
MSKSGNITDFFQRSRVPQAEKIEQNNGPKDPEAAQTDNVNPSSSPLSDPSSSLLSKSSPMQSPGSGPEEQLKRSLIWAIPQPANADDTHQQEVSPSVPAAPDSFLNGSFDSSQRIVKNGREIVTNSDGEDTDSIASLESPEELLKKLITPTEPKEDIETMDRDGTGNLRSTRGKSKKKTVDKFFAQKIPTPKYKHTLDSLVTAAVDDDETEAGVAKIRSAFHSFKKASQDDQLSANDGDVNMGIHEDVLASAVGEGDDQPGLQRLLDAVRRTEAFDQEKTWSFFQKDAPTPSPPKFPRASIRPGTREEALREPASRERAFHSGIIEMALSRGLLPDELVIWILRSVPSEPRDDLRYAYSRALKVLTSQKRISSLIRPGDIDDIFRILGARPVALAVSEPAIPEAQIHNDSSRDWKFLLSVLDMLRGAAELFADDTRERILLILFRLSLDSSVTRDSVVCSEVERAITASLEGLPKDSADSIMDHVCKSTFQTVQDAILQSRLLTHILPTSSWIALWRCRLATAFLLQDPSPLDEPPEDILNLKRITGVLRQKRFDVKLHKGKNQDYDYWELGAVTSLLNVAIDFGRSTPTFSDKEAETTFNADVDALADRVKKIFTSIEDSGASHLKRTETKERLEALHYRIVYSVRSRPPPKKSFFGSSGLDDWNGISRSGSLMDKFLSSKNGEGKEK